MNTSSDIEKDKLINELYWRAKAWRIDRERFLVPGEDNSLEVNEFEAELDEYFFPYITRLWVVGFFSKEEYVAVWSGVREEWVVLWKKANAPPSFWFKVKRYIRDKINYNGKSNYKFKAGDFRL